MNQPESPNLYWALVDLPSRKTAFSDALETERYASLSMLPNYGKLAAGEDLTTEEWKAILYRFGADQML